MDFPEEKFRIFLAEDGINVFNSQTFTKGYDPYDFFEGMKVDNDASHAFYLGIELARAQIAYCGARTPRGPRGAALSPFTQSAGRGAIRQRGRHGH